MRYLPHRIRRSSQRGAVVLFLVIVIALMSLSIHRLLPAIEPTYPRNKQMTVDELNAIAFGLRDYYFAKKAFPSSIVDTNFSHRFLNFGLQGDPVTWIGGAQQEQWYNHTDSSWTYRNASGGTSPDYWNVWSVGPDGANDSMADDDIVRSQYANVAATARTRRLLAIIRQAVTYSSVNLAVTSGGWFGTNGVGSTGKRGSGTSCTPTGGCSLGPEFDRDGWGNPFIIRSSTSVVFSAGPNEASNAGGGDDILW